MINRPCVIISCGYVCVQGRGPRRSLMSTWFSARAPAIHFASTVGKPSDQPRFHRSKGTPGGARAGVAAVEAWLVARLPTVDAKWIAGARAENKVDISDRGGPRPWTHTNISEIITQGLLIMRTTCLLSIGYFGERLPTPLCPLPAAASSPRIGSGA